MHTRRTYKGAVAAFVLAEKLAVVGRNRDVGVLGDDIEKLLDYPIQILHSFHLPIPQFIELSLVKELLCLSGNLSADNFVV